MVQMMQDIECVFQSMSGRGSIFISNLPAAQNVSLLHSKGIKAILSVARSGLVRHSKEDIPYYLYIPAEDHEDYKLELHFQQTFAFIEKARKETNVLVHCMAGVSRSVTIVVAYLLKKYKYTLEQVMSMIHRRRRKINPNRGFIDQLKKYSEAQGIKCQINARSKIKCLRDYSLSKNKQTSKDKHQSHRERKEMLSFKTTELLMLNKQQAENQQRFLKPVVVPIRKIKSFEENKTHNVTENEEIILTKHVTEVKDDKLIAESPTIHSETAMKKRGLSIEEKIKKIRDKLLKKQEDKNMAMLSMSRHSPIYRKTPQKLQQSSLQRQNRQRQVKEETKGPTKHIRVHSCSQPYEHEVPRYQRPSKLNPYALVYSPHERTQSEEKDIFGSDVKIEGSALYSHLKMNVRMNNRHHQNALLG